MIEDVGYLLALWSTLEQREAKLEQVFRERMRFFPHLNEIKMTGIPIDVTRRDTDFQKTAEEKTAVREDLRTMFADYRHPIPKSRLKTIKIQAEGGKFKRVPGSTEEEFSPSNRDHVLGAWRTVEFRSRTSRRLPFARLMLPRPGCFSNTPHPKTPGSDQGNRSFNLSR